MKSNDYYRAVLLGVIVGMASLSLLVLINPGEDVKPVEPKSNFEVVDNYKERCDVVRWTNNQLAEYKYFLHCDK
jgi:hypothetical protein